jgi:hypothetical protein
MPALLDQGPVAWPSARFDGLGAVDMVPAVNVEPSPQKLLLLIQADCGMRLLTASRSR